MMNKKYYITTKEDKVGTVFAAAEYGDDRFRQVLINKVPSNGVEAFEDITKFLIEHGIDKEVNMISLKFKDVDIANHIGNHLDKTNYFKNLSNDFHCTFFSSPSVFSNDVHKMHKAEASLGTYLILREHYAKRDLIK